MQASATVIPFNAAIPDHEQGFTLDNLTPRDRTLLCDYVFHNFPLLKNQEEIDQNLGDLERMMDAAALTPVALYRHLRNATTIPLMIAAAALRYVRRLPDDPRLAPQPHPPAPVKVPKTPLERARARKENTTLPASLAGEYVIAVVPNPKRKGTAAYERFQKYRVGISRAELRALGLNGGDFRYDAEHHYVSWGDSPRPEGEERSS